MDSKLLVGIIHFNSVYRFPQNLRGAPQYKWTPLDSNNTPEFLVASSNKYLKNQYAIIQLKTQTTPRPTGILIQIIGTVGDTKSEIEACTYYRRVFFKKWKLTISSSLLTPMSSIHTDYQDLTVYSIDPKGCRDIDDAFSYQPTVRCLGIHIADVSYLLSIYGLLEMKYFDNRYSSIYLPDKVNHMIPENLATDYASLLPNKPRFAWTLWLNLTSNNQILSWKLQRTIIKSRRAFTYDEADVDPEINLISDIVRNLGTNMLQLKYDQWTTHEMIEVLMIITNHLVASFIHEHSQLGIYRTHAKPKPNQQLVKNVHEWQLEKFLNILSSQSAEYTFDTGNYYHYGLKIDKYTHFTSPIRRFIDIYNHLLLGHIMTPESTPMPESFKIDLMLVNDFHHRTKLLQRDLDKINLISIIKTETEHQGYIIDIDNEYILDVYLPTFKILVSFPLFHKNIIALFNITNQPSNITISYNLRTITIEKLKLITLRLYPQPEALHLSQKIKIEIPVLADFVKM